MKSVMTHQFSKVPQAEIPRSSFDRSHGLKTTFDAGYLVPIFVDEALPGDTFNLNMTGFARLATPLHPVMDNMFMETFFFAVPYRLVWDNWQKFNGEQDAPGDSTDFLVPTTTSPATTGYESQSLQDYLGLPTGVGGLEHNVLCERATALIWNEWFRDENLQDPAPLSKADGPDSTEYTLRRRGKRHDYFTSGLPWPQKGESVALPLGTTAPVVPLGDRIPIWSTDSQSAVTFDAGGTGEVMHTPLAIANEQFKWNQAKLETDLSEATAATINQLRQAFQIQKLLERDARGGTRYTEIIRAHFGVTSPDQRLQRPEFLGGGSSPVNITPVPQTTPSNIVPDITPQGNLAGFGTVVLNNHGFNKSFTEHCIIIGFVNVRADLTYQQGLDRMFSRQTRYDFYWPALNSIGEQSVLNKEIYAQGENDLVADEAVFCYQERSAEYRYKQSKITGKFRSQDPQSLDVWHLAQDFANLPVLDSQFIEDNPPIDRVIAVTDEPHFIFDSYFSLRCARPMPMYGVPGMIDHF